MSGYVVTTATTPRRDVDLFGVTTVRIDRVGVPVFYLSTYVEDPEALAERVAAILSSAEEGQGTTTAAAEPCLPAYTMPEFVEDVDYAEVLPLAEDVQTTDWKAWSFAVIRRIELATTASQVAELQSVNQAGLQACPGRFRAPVGKALNDAWTILHDQAAAA